MDKETYDLCRAEGFEIERVKGEYKVFAWGKFFPVTHPFPIYCKLYREEENPDTKFIFLKRMHDILWPSDIITWHSWTDIRFQEYCRGWRIMSWASGASGGKSVDAAKLVLLDFWAAPTTTAAIVASTTINSLQARIYGYALRYLREAAVKLPYSLMRSQPPKIMYNRDDEIHCISALAAARGKDQEAIKNYIGRHPKGKLVLVLDEAPDLDACILTALPNLEAGKEGNFQCIAIGNSASKFDLHGALSTPRGRSFDSIDPMKETKWETTQERGVCLFFSCYNSPAIYEQDESKKAALSRFLITDSEIKAKEKLYGKNSDAFYRFVLGFWKSTSTDDTVISRNFLDEFGVRKVAEFAGIYPISVVAGLDPAFSTGGDQCLLRLGILGQDVRGNILLDFRKEELLFKIRIIANSEKSAELQIADQVIEILNNHKCLIGNMAVDATGQGRAIGEVIRLRAQSLLPPIKIWSTKVGSTKQNSFDVVVKTSLELWTDVRDFIQTDQLRGIDETSLNQLATRLVQIKGVAQKRSLESKSDYRVRMGSVSPSLAHSPDEADSLALCLQAARIRFGFTPGQRREVQKGVSLADEKWDTVRYLAKQKELEVKRWNPVANFLGEISQVSPFGNSNFLKH